MAVRTKRMFFLVLFSLFFVYLIFLGLVYLRQGSMVYYPSREIVNTPGDIGFDFKEVTLRTKDNIKISAWHIPAKNERGVVLFFHGNAGNISHRLDSIRIFHDFNLTVFIFDYRGFGKSEGYPTEKGTYIDAESAWEYLVHIKNIDPKKIILFGRSLGSAVAAELALRHKAGALIIESGFTSVPDLGSKFYPYLPLRLISRFHYATADKVNKIDIPKLFIHSPQDEIIPFEHGTKLFDKARRPKEFLQMKGNHNDGFIISGRAYIEGLDGFISKYL
jgi:fermentation-respiration switch protein FrsA (DUF1100 family)